MPLAYALEHVFEIGERFENVEFCFDHKDGLGSVVALSDGANGDMTDSYAYDPYGESASLTGNAFRFAGMRLDPESGLYYDRARYYAPALGRFLQTDPIGTRGGINLYAYVDNDPINLLDRNGKCIEDLCIGETILAVELITEGVELFEAATAVTEVAAVTTEAASAATEAATAAEAATTAATASAPSIAAGSTAESAITATAGEQAFDIGANPLAGTTKIVGIPENPAISGSPLLEVPDFSPTLTSKSANAAIAAATAAAGLLENYNVLEPRK